MNPFSLAIGGAVAVLVSLAAPLAAQADGKPAATKLEEWPALKDTDKDRVRALAGQFRKPDPALHEEAKKQLVAIGDAGAPVLMSLVSDRAENSNDVLFAILDQVTGPQHAALLARETKKPGVELRRYLARRLCRFGDASLTGLFETLQKDKDEATAFCAQLALLAQRRREAVQPVLAYTKTRWKDVGDLVAEVLTPARSRELGELVFEAIAKAAPVDQMAGLRLLRFTMTKDQGTLLRVYLEAAEHTVKREAVNTARVLHGEPATDNLSVFQAIEQAKQWLQKI
jgi:hypothetical protein